MIALIFFTLLLAKQASSSPVPKEPSKTDAKIMNCVVEVISDTLSNPSPLPISQECMEALKGDERIISMLRHQNLLREFQELAAEGANEKALQMKQNNNFKEKQLEVLKNNGNKKISSLDNSEENPAGQHRSSAEEVKMEEEIGKEKQPAVRRHRYMNLVDTTTDSSSIITLRDGETARKVPIGDEPFKSTSSESESDVGPSQDQRQSEEHNAEAHEDEYTEEVSEDHVKESSDEEETHNPNEDSKDEELIYSEEPSQEDWVDEATNSDSSEVKENGKGSDEEIRSNGNSERHQNSENVEEEYSSKNDGKDELSVEWEEGKQKMEELVPEKKLRKHEASGEDKLIRFENLKPHGRHGNFQHVQGNRRSHPEEVRQKDKVAIASPALRKQLDVEDKKEEEGSATRKNEEQEVESLEEIESELEAMARRLHEMRSI